MAVEAFLTKIQK